jgi:uncharacterized protein Usg
MVNDEFRSRMQGFHVATAEVLYYMPDHPSLLQSFLWQTMDRAPDYPRLRRFLNFWKREIYAVIHSVRIASGESLSPATYRAATHWTHLN